MLSYIYMHKPACIHTYVHTRMHSYIHTYIRTYISTYIYIYIFVSVSKLNYESNNCREFIV
jgi:hypothetical protein